MPLSCSVCVVWLQMLGLPGYYGFLTSIAASSPGLFKRESSLCVSVAFPLVTAASGRKEASQVQKLLGGLEYLTALHPQKLTSAEGHFQHRLFSLDDEYLSWGKISPFLPHPLTIEMSCAQTKAHIQSARRPISTYCSSCQHFINHLLAFHPVPLLQ